ncbi:MAG: tyrosine-type recombinase/integrase [Actinobacteria bacterium]|nr:tyrosine-type recombinase/integrase [Actinomycetota bacterium]
MAGTTASLRKVDREMVALVVSLANERHYESFIIDAVCARARPFGVVFSDVLVYQATKPTWEEPPSAPLHITESLAEVLGTLYFGPTKSYRQRMVVMPGEIRDLLAHHLEGIGQEPEALVFVSPTGRPLRYSNFRNRVWRPATEMAGLSDLDVHELRHTAASLMISRGGDPKLIQTQLGNSSISVTYDIYGHLFPDRLDEPAAGLDDLFRSARAPTADAGSLATVSALRPPI